MPTLEPMQKGYAKMWDESIVVPDKNDAATKLAARLLKDKPRYMAVAKKVGCPWHLVAGYNLRESDCNFTTHLHCGDSLSARTKHVPAGRPKAEPASGHLPYTWEESAVDALTMPGKEYGKVNHWSLERTLYQAEGYNGWGYLSKGNTPYLWSWTNEYHGGKYVADHKYDPNVWDKQPGLVAVWKALAYQRDPEVLAWMKDREAKAPADAHLPATRTERGTRTGAAVGGASGGAIEAEKKAITVQQTDEVGFLSPVFTYSLIGAAVAIAIICTVLIERKKRAVKAKWEGASA